MIVAFDTSTRRTGWVRGEPGGAVRIGSFGVREAARDNLGRLVAEWAEVAWPLIEGCSHVYFEAPIQPHGHTNFSAQRKLYALTAHVEFLAYHAQADCVEVDQSTHKKLIYDHGGGKPINAVEYANAWGMPARNEDEADACGVYLHALKTEFPAAFSKWLTIRRQSPIVVRIAKPIKRQRAAPGKTRQRKSARIEPTLF